VPRVLQVPGHLPDPVEGGVEELLVDELHFLLKQARMQNDLNRIHMLIFHMRNL
jgi:hypothetical protein